MKTSVDIPEADLAGILAVTQAATKRDAILIAVRDYTARARRAQLNAQLKGAFRDVIDVDELQALRRRP